METYLVLWVLDIICCHDCPKAPDLRGRAQVKAAAGNRSLYLVGLGFYFHLGGSGQKRHINVILNSLLHRVVTRWICF